jgi:hypothetical protein
MIYDCNIILMFIAAMLLVALVFGKKEGFSIDPHDSSGYIPYVPQDFLCMILKASGVDIDRLGVMKNKCKFSEDDKQKPPENDICRT